MSFSWIYCSIPKTKQQRQRTFQDLTMNTATKNNWSLSSISHSRIVFQYLFTVSFVALLDHRCPPPIQKMYPSVSRNQLFLLVFTIHFSFFLFPFAFLPISFTTCDTQCGTTYELLWSVGEKKWSKERFGKNLDEEKNYSIFFRKISNWKIVVYLLLKVLLQYTKSTNCGGSSRAGTPFLHWSNEKKYLSQKAFLING